MAKSADSKVIFVPMQLQNDVVSQMARQEGGPGAPTFAGGSGSGGSSTAERAGILSAMSDV